MVEKKREELVEEARELKESITRLKEETKKLFFL
tara:strand:- start:2145 stop:2246 length:102 start_codon:yes stop_codon:yes gene_type:complete